MEDRAKMIEFKKNTRVQMSIIPGHYATSHSHVNYYVDLTSVKTSLNTAREAAKELASQFSATQVDTVICLEGTDILGAFLAEYLSQAGINVNADISLITPETNSNNQLLFRDNVQKKIWGKNVLLLISSASTGKSINRAIECMQYYNGTLVGIGAIFSAIKAIHGMEIRSLFTEADIPNYINVLPADCPMCRNGQKVDALINSFGYSKL
ncbi:MAG: orotate phosphoribosyltransferase [Oscillospiraceae bacterium]|nr:orotate phosphoribosyltransferase [Oscillospiraceae bacterium]